MKVLCVSMIAWQETIIMVAIGVINFLLEKDFISEPVDYRRVMSFRLDISFVALLWTKFRTIREFE